MPPIPLLQLFKHLHQHRRRLHRQLPLHHQLPFQQLQSQHQQQLQSQHQQQLQLPTPTTTPIPTATPSITSSKLNAIWLEHPETEYLNQNQQATVQKLLNSNTKIVFVQIGNWKQSGSTVSISYWWSTQTIKNTVSAIKTYSNNQIEVHAWIIWSTGNTRVNLADSSIRAKTVTAAVNCVQSYGFDGFNDDLYEGFTGSDSNYVTYANAHRQRPNSNRQKIKRRPIRNVLNKHTNTIRRNHSSNIRLPNVLRQPALVSTVDQRPNKRSTFQFKMPSISRLNDYAR